MTSIRKYLTALYGGQSQKATIFRYALLILDVLAVAFFIVASFYKITPTLFYIEFVLGFVFLLDYAARFVISGNRLKYVFNPLSIADAIVIVSLFSPAFGGSFAFLRVLRALLLLRSYHAIAELQRYSPRIARNQDVLYSIVNLLVFIFVVTAFVYVFEAGQNPQIKNYVDALYFTVATLTTTGFGDITLTDTHGRLLAVLIMIFGISLFIRLAQTIFRPSKVNYKCLNCGLSRHDPDAVHCKHCGEVINIETEGSRF